MTSNQSSVTKSVSSRAQSRELFFHHPAMPDSTIQNSTLRIHNFLQCFSVYSVVGNLCSFVFIRGSKQEQLGVILDNNGVVWAHFGVLLDMFGVTMDKLGGINGHKNIVFEIKTLFLRIFYGIIMALEYSTKTEYN